MARAFLLAIALVVWLPGCGMLSRADKPSLHLQLKLVESSEGETVRPYVVLVGDRELLASNKVEWTITAVLADGGRFNLAFPDSVFGESGRFNNPYYVYRGWPSIPDDLRLLVGSSEAPIWVGPDLDASLLKNARSVKVDFALQLYSPAEAQIVSRSYQWSYNAQLITDPKLYPLD